MSMWILIVLLFSATGRSQEPAPDSLRSSSFAIELQRQQMERLEALRRKKAEPPILFEYTASELRAIVPPPGWFFAPPFSLHLSNPFPSWMDYPCAWSPEGSNCSPESQHVPQPRYSALDKTGSFELFIKMRAAEVAIERIVEEYASLNFKTAQMYYLFKKKGVDPSKVQWTVVPPSPFSPVYEEELENLRRFHADLARRYPDNEEAQRQAVATSPPSPGFLREKLNRIPPSREVNVPPVLKELSHESMQARCSANIDGDRVVKLFIERTYDRRAKDHPLCNRAYKKDDTSCYTYVYNAYVELAEFYRQDGQSKVQQTSGSVYLFVTDETTVNKIHNDFSYARERVAYQLSIGDSKVEYSLPQGRTYALRTPIQRIAQSVVVSVSRDGELQSRDAVGSEVPAGSEIVLDGNVSLVGKTYINLPETFHVKAISFGKEKFENFDLSCKSYFNDTRV